MPGAKYVMADDGASNEPMLRWFEYQHLPLELQEVSHSYYHLAHHLVNSVPRSPERTVALRKLLESKDAAVRSALPPL